MDDLSGILVYEAMRTAKAHAFEVRTPLGPTTGTRLSNPPLVVPVLRAGLGMLGGILRYLPETDTGFIGLARNEETYLPESYMNSVPEELGGRPVLVLRSEEHTSELQSLMRTSYAVFCLQKKNTTIHIKNTR